MRFLNSTTLDCGTQNALLCQSMACNICSKKHLGCLRIPLKDITALIQKQTDDLRDFVVKMMNIENTMIRGLKDFNKSLADTYAQLYLPERLKQIIERIFQKRDSLNVDRSLVLELVTLLQKNSNSDKIIMQENKLLLEFAQHTKQIFRQLTSKKEELIKCFSQGLPSEGVLTQKIDSKIISSPKDITFIKESLNKPAKLQLLFRASDHDFLVSQFHKACDNIPHTLTIVKTQFNKTIAGYTPLCWESLKDQYGKGQAVADHSEKSFLLSIDLKQKMTLVNKDRAIYCSSGVGPCFGDADIGIIDRCHEESTQGWFSQSYNYEDKYKEGQQAWAAFYGCSQGNKYRVLEYEVYKVIWQ